MKRLFCVPIRYTEWLLIHPTHFLIALPGWVLALAGLFWWTDETRAVDWRVQLLESIEHAIVAFFAGGTPILHSRELAEVHGSGQLAVICLALVSGVFHLGVFISHLYTLVVRR